MLTKVPIESVSDLHIGDHVLIDSQHYIIQHIEIEHKTFMAYTITKHGNVELISREKMHNYTKSKKFRIDYEPQSSVCDTTQTLDMAKEEMHKKSKWKRSDQFVTFMKCGTKHVIDDRCFMSHDVDMVGSTRVSPYVSVDNGDHLLIRDTHNPEIFHSVLVSNFVTETEVVITPPITTSIVDESHKQEMIDLGTYPEVYRVNYSHSLQLADVIERAKSTDGERILLKLKNTNNYGPFVTWAKTGKEMEVPVQQLIMKQQVAAVHPLQYRKILSPHEIQLGDHLVQYQWLKRYREHLLVTELSADRENPTRIKVIHCSHMCIKEEVWELDPNSAKNDIYRIQYQDELPTELTLKRAQSCLGQHKLSPLARMWFVRWAKTGSKDGIEVDFLRNVCKPVTKSRIACFTQLNPGDYLVEGNHHDKSTLNKIRFYHHYLVVSVESPEKCTVIESWRRKIKTQALDLHQKGRKVSKQDLEINEASTFEDHLWFYRINYDAGVCMSAKESIAKAQKLIEEDTLHWNPFSECARRSFVHYLKTGESSDINIDDLPDDRMLLPREKVSSAMELKPGDHIERPLNVPVISKYTQHHMLVVEPIDNERCKVIHYQTHPTARELLQMKKGKVAQEVVNIFDKDECFRVCYPERIDPEKGLSDLSQLCGEEGKGKLKSITGNVSCSVSVTDEVLTCVHAILICEQLSCITRFLFCTLLPGELP